jgi:hypothetical protein
MVKFYGMAMNQYSFPEKHFFFLPLRYNVSKKGWKWKMSFEIFNPGRRKGTKKSRFENLKIGETVLLKNISKSYKHQIKVAALKFMTKTERALSYEVQADGAILVRREK